MVGAIAFVPEEDVDEIWMILKPLLPPDMNSQDIMKLHGSATLATDLHLRMTRGTRTPLHSKKDSSYLGILYVLTSRKPLYDAKESKVKLKLNAKQ